MRRITGLKWGDYLFGILAAEVCHKVDPTYIVPGWLLGVLSVLTLWLWYRG